MPLEIDLGQVEVCGFYRVEKLKGARVVHDTGFFPNLITDYGMNIMGTASGSANIYGFLRVGTSSAAPSFSDLALGNQIGSSFSMTSTAGVNIDDGYAWRRNVWTFAEGAVVGNIAELGTGGLESGNNLFSRALVLDSGGTPTTITILADEVLRVTWEHRRYWSTSDSTGSVVNSGNKGGTFSWLTRPALAGSWSVPMVNGAMAFAAGNNLNYFGAVGAGPITGEPTGTQTPGGRSLAELGYTAGTFKRRARISYSLTQGIDAAGALGGITFNAGGTIWQLVITPGILKTTSEFLDLDVSVTWARRP